MGNDVLAEVRIGERETQLSHFQVSYGAACCEERLPLFTFGGCLLPYKVDQRSREAGCLGVVPNNAHVAVFKILIRRGSVSELTQAMCELTPE